MLSTEDLESIVAAALACGLEEPERRQLLFRGIPDTYRASLQRQGKPLDQLRSDLGELNRQAALEGLDQLPLALWLHNAERLAGPRPQARTFRQLRARLPGYKEDPPPPPPPPPPPERTNWVMWVIALLGLVALAAFAIKALLPDSPPAPSPTSDRLAEADRLAGIGQREEATQIYQSLVVDSPNQRQQARLHWGRAMRDWCKRGCTAAERALGRYVLSGVLPADEAHVPSFAINGSESMAAEEQAKAQALRAELYKECPTEKPWMPNPRRPVQLLCIPGGKVLVRNEEGTTVDVDVESFHIGLTEITYRQYKQTEVPWPGCDAEYDREDKQDEPVRCVDRSGALEAASKIASGLTLPTWAQWKRALETKADQLQNMRAGAEEWLLGVPAQVAGEFMRGEGRVPPDAAARVTVRDGVLPRLDGYRSTRRRSDTGFRVALPIPD